MTPTASGSAPVELAAWRAERAEPEPEPGALRALAEAGGILGEVRDRIEHLERRLSALERKTRRTPR